jgi:hypothetical protein
VGPGFTLSEELSPLAPVRDYVSVVSGCNDPFPDILGHHDGWVSMLTGSNERTNEGRPGDGYFIQPTIDQVVAAHWKGRAPFDSVQILVSQMGAGGGPGYGVGISQPGGGQVNPGIHDPAELFRYLFGGGRMGDPAAAAAAQAQASVLDQFLAEGNRLRARLGAADRARMDAYLSSLRAIEGRIAQMPAQCAAPNQPAAQSDDLGHEDLVGRGRLLADILVAALQCDLTRVFTIEFTPMQATTIYWQLGASEYYHTITHADTELPNQAVRFNMGELAYLLQKLAATPEGDGTLLDRVCIYTSSEVAEGDTHSRADMPILISGKAGGGLRGSIHYRSPSGEPVTSAQLTVLQAIDLPLTSFGQGAGYTTSPIGALCP